MKQPGCARERDVLRAVAREWRAEADAHVAAHVASATAAADVRAAAELLRAEHVRDTQAARVPSPAAMWWRLERRLRAGTRAAAAASRLRHAGHRARRGARRRGRGPANDGAVARRFRQNRRRTWQAAVTVLTTWAEATSAWTLPIAIVAAAWALLVPAALYLGLADE